MEIASSSDDCTICARWPTALRPVMRDIIERIQGNKPLCEECLVAFWNNCVVRGSLPPLDPLD
jgi:hypothetical protein